MSVQRFLRFTAFLGVPSLFVEAQVTPPEDCCHVVQLRATPTTSSSSSTEWSFAATMWSPYEATTGWDKYCDAFEIRSSDGEVLATRVLAHPHPNEQPFTRGTFGSIQLPINTADETGVISVTAVARDSVVGYCGDAVVLEIGSGVAETIVATRVPTLAPETIQTNATSSDSNSTISPMPSWAPSLNESDMHASVGGDISTFEPSMSPDTIAPSIEIVVTPQETNVLDDCCHVIKLQATPMFTEDNAKVAWQFAATMSSPYEEITGWDKYCDEFQIQSSLDGEILSTRVLAHPHANEQPFTRSTNGAVVLPEGIMSVSAVARDSVSGYCGTGVVLELPAADDEEAFAGPSNAFVATQPPTVVVTGSPDTDSVDTATNSPTMQPSAAANGSGFGKRFFIVMFCAEMIQTFS